MPALHHVGTILGFVGAIAAAVLMLGLKTDEKRLRRGRIARRIAPVTWCGIILLIVSGVMLTVDNPAGYSLQLVIKHVFVLIILVDAFFIHFRFFPRYFNRIGTPEFDENYARMRRVGTLSVASWIIVLALSISSTM